LPPSRGHPLGHFGGPSFSIFYKNYLIKRQIWDAMEVFTQTELNLRQKEIIKKIKDGAIFIHPSDTIYGIGCNALDEKAVKKLREIKERPDTPLSVWVPSMEWVEKNCVESDRIEKLPGPYTLIVEVKVNNAVAKNVGKGNTLGIRFPEHWFSEIVQKLGLPIVTTSANKTGQSFMTNLENLDPDIEKQVDFMIYEGEKKARPSKIIDTSGLVKDR
jgi:L-threonylcarbamoyladenylate synthase